MAEPSENNNIAAESQRRRKKNQRPHFSGLSILGGAVGFSLCVSAPLRRYCSTPL